MKKILFLFICILIFNNQAYSQTVYDDNYVENPNYVQGNKYLENSQYSSAINEFKKAVRTNPADKSALIGLSNAYNMRAQYYNNTVKATENAITDLKSAIFFLKYYYSDNTDTSLSSSIAAMEKNLSVLESASKQSITPQDRLNNAKALRIKGEFAASAYDYYKLLNNSQYKAQASLALGDIYKILNRPQKALEMYKTALTIDSNNTDLHLKLARVYEELNDFSSSLKEYSYALNTSSDSEDILSSLERIWQKKVDENPNNAENHDNLGVIFQKQKRYWEAIQEYRTAEALNPSNINTKINIGTLYQEQKKYDAAINVYDSILKLQPHNANVIIYKAECMKALNRNADAIELYKTALNLEPKNASVKANLFELLKNTMPADELITFLYKNVPNAQLSADEYYQFAYELHKANKISDAITYYLETIKLDNKNIDAYINLSQAYRQNKSYKEAFDIIKKAQLIAPDNEQVKRQYALIEKECTAINYDTASNAFDSGDYNKAIEEYKKINPPTSDSYLGIAASYQALNNITQAIDYYKKSMELNPKNADIPFYIASLYSNNNDLENAKIYTELSLKINPSHKQAKELHMYISAKEEENLITDAIKLYDSQKYSESAAILTGLIKNNTTNASVFYYRALCYDALNQIENAVADYKNTLKYAPDMVIVYYSLGVDYDSLKNYKTAKEYYKKYTEAVVEDNDYKKYAQSRIDEIK